MYAPISLCTTDCAHLGRLEYSTMPQQALMELVVRDLPDRDAFEDENDHFYDINEWEGVICDDKMHVTAIRWASRMFNGVLDLQWLPRTLIVFDVTSNAFCGSVESRLLPQALNHFILTDNGFMGSIDLTRLPRSILCFILTDNVFSGTLNFSRLPSSLISLDVSRNEFSGILDLSAIDRPMMLTDFGAEPELDYAGGTPERELYVDFSDNFFAGDVLVSHLGNLRELTMFKSLRCGQAVEKCGNTVSIADIP